MLSLSQHMAKRQQKYDPCDDLSIGFIITLGWFFWSIWLGISLKSPANKFGVVSVCLILVAFTVRFLKQFITLFIIALALPIAIVCSIVFITFRIISFVLSPLCVVSIRPFWRPAPRTCYCRLCEKCERITGSSPLLVGSPWIFTKPSERYAFHSTSELIASSKECHLCQILLESILSFKDDVIEYHDTNRSQRRCQKSNPYEIATKKSDAFARPASITLKIWASLYILKSPVMKMQLLGQSITESRYVDIVLEKLAGMRHRCYDSINTSSGDVAEWAKEWVERCSEGHKSCQSEFVPTNVKNYRPLRLLDVQGGDRGFTYLVCTDELTYAGPVEYCALSHCWGGTVTFQLKKENIDALKCGFETGILSKNFRDAVTITRRLGVCYLWIDSLCIVQNDILEWEAQSKEMGLVYANARCVISATASMDSSGGCFQPRTLSYNDCILRTWGNHTLAVRAARVPLQTHGLFERLVDQAPLTTRAWTFQERYLARRTLHFCDGLVLFECNTLTASEYSQSGQVYGHQPDVRRDGKLHALADLSAIEKQVVKFSPAKPKRHGVPKWDRTSRKQWERERVVRSQWTAQQDLRVGLLEASAWLGTRGSFDFLWRFRGKSLPEKMEFHNRWFDLVGQYSGRQLSFGKDKAMAIAGVAFFVQQNVGLQYIDGIWKEMLPIDLLWTVPQISLPRPARSVPSWSWIAVDGRIENPIRVDADPIRAASKHYISQPQVYRSSWREVMPLTSEEEVLRNVAQTSVLKLRGQLFKLDTRASRATNEQLLQAYLQLKCQPQQTKSAPSNSRSEVVKFLFDTSDVPPHDEIYCLPVLSFKNSRFNSRTRVLGSSSDLTHTHGILLRKLFFPESFVGQTDRFERVGYFSTSDPAIVEALNSQTGENFTSRIEIV